MFEFQEVFIENLSAMDGLKTFLFGPSYLDDDDERNVTNNERAFVFAKEIASSLEDNYVLQEISYMDDLDRSERFHLDLNQNGRMLLYKEDVPVLLWPVVFSRIAQRGHTHLLNYMLLRKVELLATTRQRLDH